MSSRRVLGLVLTLLVGAAVARAAAAPPALTAGQKAKLAECERLLQEAPGCGRSAPTGSPWRPSSAYLPWRRGKEKVSRLEALRQAQLAVLNNPGRVRQRREVLLADARKRGVPAPP